MAYKEETAICDLTLAEVNAMLAYDRETGILTWKDRGDYGSRRFIGKVAGWLMQSGHRALKINGRSYLAHRVAWLMVYGEWPKGEIDHINHNPDDNRISNLRVATSAQNCWNTRVRKTSSTGFKGVYRSGRKWFSMITVNGESKYLGLFEAPELAHAAYVDAARKFHGEFAHG